MSLQSMRPIVSRLQYHSTVMELICCKEQRVKSSKISSIVKKPIILGSKDACLKRCK